MRGWLRPLCAATARRAPLRSGLGRLANAWLPQSLSQKGGSVWASLRDGSTILVHPDDYIGRTIVFFGDLDPKISWFCRGVLCSGDTVVDVGANYGVISLQAARVVGERGRVHAFEPQREIAQMLGEAAERNGFKQLVTHAVGLSDTDGSANLHVPIGNRGMSSLDENGTRSISETIELRSGSDYLSELINEHVALMKIDVEGHEDQVVRGAAEWLARVRPEILLIEAREGEGIWQKEWVTQLLALGYSLFGIPRTLFRDPVPRRLSRERGFRFHDIVAVSDRPEARRRIGLVSRSYPSPVQATNLGGDGFTMSRDVGIGR